VVKVYKLKACFKDTGTLSQAQHERVDISKIALNNTWNSMGNICFVLVFHRNKVFSVDQILRLLLKFQYDTSDLMSKSYITIFNDCCGLLSHITILDDFYGLPPSLYINFPGAKIQSLGNTCNSVPVKWLLYFLNLDQTKEVLYKRKLIM
jgi:hypothetical protein